MNEQKKTLTDHQVINLDREIRISKIGQRYEPKQADDIVRCLNQLDDNLSMILAEMRRLCDILSYLTRKQNEA